jgi:hypothetical protein
MWLDLDGPWQTCHWWQVLDERRIAAMFILILILALSASVIALAALVALDGYGSRPAPRSHPRDVFEPSRTTDRDLVG